MTTWSWLEATNQAWDVLSLGESAMNAVEKGCNVCENFPATCGWSVGFGGSPNENGETTLDAMIMNGDTHGVGAVGCLKRVKNAISVARTVLEQTTHTMLVGDDATVFAVKWFGFKEESLQTERSKELWEEWNAGGHVPNYWRFPHNYSNDFPYPPPQSTDRFIDLTSRISVETRDTIGMLAIDDKGRIAAGTSTNGKSFKIPGRVGDSPITGAGAYADSAIGAAAATGDGDVMMRFLPSYRAVMNLENGMTAKQAAEDAIRRIAIKEPNFSGAVIVISKDGDYGAAAFNTEFSFCVHNEEMQSTQIIPVTPLIL